MKINTAEIHQYSFHTENKFSWKSPAGVKNTLIHFSLVVLFTLLVSYFFATYMKVPLQMITRIVFAILFLSIGLIHVFIFPKWLSHLLKPGLTWGVIYSLSLAIIISGFSYLLFYVNGSNQSGTAIAAGSSFLLPSSVYLSVYYFKGIRVKYYQPWYIPADIKPEKKMTLLYDSIFFKLMIKKEAADKTSALVSITSPAKQKLGAAFCRFLDDQHGAIEEAGGNKQKYGWFFSTKGILGTRMLNPDLTIAENKIREDDIIVAERAGNEL